MESAAKWTPSSFDERNYYDRLFLLADGSSTGKLAGQPAVTFLGKSGLAIPILKQVWDIAADGSLNYLRREDFYVAMRLITMAQNSPAGLNGSISEERLIAESGQPLPMPRMQGFPVPPSGICSSGALGLEATASTDPYTMSPQERSNYESWFSMYDADQDGFITGQEARAFFSKSRLPRENLRQIWDLADADNDAKLSLGEFCVAMHLILCASKKGLAIPGTLPQSLTMGGAGSSLPAGPDAASGGSSSTPGLQTSGVRSSPTAQPSATPASALSTPMAAMNLTDRGDAFSSLSKEVPVKGPTSSSNADSETEGIRSVSPLELLASFPESSVSNAQPQENAMSHSRDVTASSKGSTRDDSTEGAWVGSVESQPDPQELTAASNALLDVVQSASVSQTQAVKLQTSTLQNVGALVRELKGQKESLQTILDTNKAVYLDNERQLQEMNLELEGLQKELSSLRKQFQDQDEKTKMLRKLVIQAAGQRGNLLAEITACKSAMKTQQEESEYLRSDAMMGTSTLDAIDTLKARLRQDGAQEQSAPKEEVVTLKHDSSTTEHPPASASYRKPDSKSEAPSEPIMPTEMPPPRPEMMSTSRVVEDPFAEMLSKENDAEKDGASQTTEAVGDMSTQANSGSEVKSQGLFDAFQTVGDAFESDPFSVTSLSFSGTGGEETVEDDPFAATDAVFSSATAAATQVFDAFPSSSEAEAAGFGGFAQ